MSNKLFLPQDVDALLNNGETIPKFVTSVISVGGQTFIEVSSFMNWLADLSDECMSDQKQEAYRGLRKMLALMVANDGGK